MRTADALGVLPRFAGRCRARVFVYVHVYYYRSHTAAVWGSYHQVRSREKDQKPTETFQVPQKGSQK